MLRNHFSWRKREKLENIADWECPEVIQKYFTGGLFGVDVDGCPVWIDPFGQIDLKGMLKSAKKADIIKAKVQLLEKLHRETFLDLSKQKGQRVESLIILYDLARLGMKHLYKPGVDAYCEMITMFEDHYPETLKYAIVINAPRFFPIAYNIVKPFLSEATAKKTIILGTNYHDTLYRYISPEQLPVCYGGKRTDPDGNPTCRSQIGQGGEVPLSYYKQQMLSADIDNAVCVSVGRGSSLQVECEVTVKNSAIRWQFSTQGYDIGFGVYRRTTGERQKASKMEEVVPTHRVNSHLVPEDGSVTCTEAGTSGCHGQGESSRSQLYSFRAICYLTGSEFLKYPRHFTKSKDLEWGIFSVNGLLPDLDYSVPFQSEKFCFIVLMLAEYMTFMGYQAYRAKKFSETHLLQL